MNSRIGLWLALGLCNFSWATVFQQSLGRHTHYHFQIPGITETVESYEEENYTLPRLKGVDGYDGLFFESGKPQLPALRLIVDGEGPIRVEMDEHSVEAIVKENGFPLLPAFESPPRIKGARYHIESTFDDLTPLLPEKDFDVVEMGSVKGKRRRLVSVYPLRFRAKDSTYLLTKRLVVTVPRVLPPAPQLPEILYVVAKPFHRSPSLVRYQKFHQSLGYRVHRLLLEVETPKTLRTKIQSAYRANPSLDYVILFGDQEQIPGYVSPRVQGVTDHYYRAIDTSDYELDIGTPDLFLGRVPVSDDAQLAIVVDKNIRYVRGKFLHRDWLRRASLITTDDTENFAEAERTMDYLIGIHTKALAFLGNFPSSLIAGGDRLFAITHKATGEDVIRMWNEGRGFVTYGGHGDVNGWEGPEMTIADLDKLTHPEANPVVTSHSCNTGQFTDDSFAEALLRHPRGAVLVWASMDIDFWGDGDVLQRLYYDAIFRHRFDDFGQVHHRAIEAFWKKYGGQGHSKYFWEDYITFGDPTLKMWR